jgi:hypothetical protein
MLNANVVAKASEWYGANMRLWVGCDAVRFDIYIYIYIYVYIHEGDSNEKNKSAIKIQNTARLSCKLTIMILMI